MSVYVRIDRGGGHMAGQLFRHKDDPKRWMVRVFLHRDESGRKKYRSEVVHGSRRQADARLLELLQTKSVGQLQPRAHMNLRDLVKEWMQLKEHEVSARTMEGYRHALEHNVLPSLGHRKIGDIHLREVDALYGAMARGELPAPSGGKGVTGRALGARSIRLAHTALSQALALAVRWGMIPHNPAAEASLPSYRAREKQVLSVSERDRFLTACKASFYGAFYQLLLDTGLRPGEACGLRWEDVDLAYGRLTVQRTVTKGKSSDGLLAEPKTTRSRRTVPLLGGLRDELARHMDLQRGLGLDDSGFVFTNQEGRMLRPWAFSTGDLRRLLKQAGITKSVTLYSLRHTFATAAVAASVPLKVVSDLMGHSTISVTADTYSHVDAETTEDWMRKFDTRLQEASEVVRNAQAVAN